MNFFIFIYLFIYFFFWGNEGTVIDDYWEKVNDRKPCYFTILFQHFEAFELSFMRSVFGLIKTEVFLHFFTTRRNLCILFSYESSDPCFPSFLHFKCRALIFCYPKKHSILFLFLRLFHVQ